VGTPAAPTPANGPATPATPPANGQQPQANNGGLMDVGNGLASASGMSQGLASGGGGGMPGMIGDFLGPYYLRVIPGVVINTATGDSDPTLFFNGLPILSRGPYKIADNESPEPQDRVFANYNFFKIRGNLPDIGPRIEGIDLHRLTVGFEKTFWNGHGSIGLRAPFFSSNFFGRTLIDQNEDGGFDVAIPKVGVLEDDELGDISVIIKVAVGSCQAHKLCSVGMVFTLPTGPSIEAFDFGKGLDEDKHSGIIQPFAGYLITGDNWYVHGFFSVAFPTHTGDDVIIMFNDIGVGYYLYGDPPNCNGCGGWGCDTCGLGCCGMLGYVPMWVTSIVPTLELHLNTPLSHGGKFEYFADTPGVNSFLVGTRENVVMSQSLIMTGGVHFGIGGSSTLTLGAAVPLNVQPFDVEGIIQLNCRF
jgi:hypothetical protein